jgi:hypothetical protein
MGAQGEGTKFKPPYCKKKKKKKDEENISLSFNILGLIITSLWLGCTFNLLFTHMNTYIYLIFNKY